MQASSGMESHLNVQQDAAMQASSGMLRTVTASEALQVRLVVSRCGSSGYGTSSKIEK